MANTRCAQLRSTKWTHFWYSRLKWKKWFVSQISLECEKKIANCSNGYQQKTKQKYFLFKFPRKTIFCSANFLFFYFCCCCIEKICVRQCVAVASIIHTYTLHTFFHEPGTCNKNAFSQIINWVKSLFYSLKPNASGYYYVRGTRIMQEHWAQSADNQTWYLSVVTA